MNLNTKKILLMMFLIQFMLLSIGCGAIDDNNSKEKPIIAVSIVPQKTFVEAVVGDSYEVIVLIPPGNSPSNYEPTPQEIEKFNDASIFFSIGVPAEASNIDELASEMDGLINIPLHEAVAAVYPEVEISPGMRDSHIWLSPKRVIVMVETIASKMSELNPELKEQFTVNANAYISQLQTLDTEIKATLSELVNRKFIVFHPAFSYLASDYDMQMFALEENGKEATAKRIRSMIDFAKKENIKVLFYQAEISSKQAESFADEIDAKMVQLDPLSGDYIENLRKMVQVMSEALK